jgi:hypothetical protein
MVHFGGEEGTTLTKLFLILFRRSVAVARKLAVIMHQMWTTGEEFRWSNSEPAAA